jgi:hypothetical protein
MAGNICQALLDGWPRDMNDLNKEGGGGGGGGGEDGRTLDKLLAGASTRPLISST